MRARSAVDFVWQPLSPCQLSDENPALWKTNTMAKLSWLQHGETFLTKTGLVRLSNYMAAALKDIAMVVHGFMSMDVHGFTRVHVNRMHTGSCQWMYTGSQATGCTRVHVNIVSLSFARTNRYHRARSATQPPLADRESSMVVKSIHIFQHVSNVRKHDGKKDATPNLPNKLNPDSFQTFKTNLTHILHTSK